MNQQTFAAEVLAAEGSLYRVARTILPYGSDCEDAVQEAICKAWEKRNTLRQPEYFRTWLTRILIHECYRLARSRPDSVPLEDCEQLLTTEGEPVDMDLRRAVLSLPAKFRLPVVLYYVEGYSVGETAQLLRIPAGTVKSRLNKARKMLRETLQEREEQ